MFHITCPDHHDHQQRKLTIQQNYQFFVPEQKSRIVLLKL